jgi:hypothetical protein
VVVSQEEVRSSSSSLLSRARDGVAAEDHDFGTLRRRRIPIVVDRNATP